MIVPVSDQDRALEFYLETLGFEQRADIPFGRGERWVEVDADEAVMRMGAPIPPMFFFRDVDGSRLLIVQGA